MVYANVGRIRRAKNITKVRMAHELNLSPMGYHHLESGSVRLDVERLKRIGKILNVDPAVFLDDTLTDSVIKQLNQSRPA